MSPAIVIDARAVPKGRPRFSRKGHAYTPAATRAWEDHVAWTWKCANGTTEPLTGPVVLSVIIAGRRTLSGDLDNYLKAISDALNGVAWVDDRQIVKIYAQKCQGDRDSVLIHVEEEPCDTPSS